MRHKQRTHVVRRLLTSARYEVLPTAKAEAAVVEHVPVGRTITVTASPGKGLGATLDLCERLAGHGYHAVPHLAARMIGGRAELAEISTRLVAVGVDTVFVPAGDAEPAAGAYRSAVDLLEDLTSLGSPFRHVGVTGYPESHPRIGDDLTVQAMWDKRRHATQIVSNLCFDAAVVSEWVRRLRSRGITMPLLVGMPGPVERTKLLGMATKIGVGESTKFLAKNTSVFARIAAPGGWSPGRFLEKAAPTLGDPGALVTGLHLFTFNQVAETESWRRRLLAELGAAPVAG
ncbi:MAG: methylenetetrahydrofolate reductase [Actinomycetota bacterium]|nr:methylenetetrahydrofolate reductase [Actinomycetota bacterium]